MSGSYSPSAEEVARLRRQVESLWSRERDTLRELGLTAGLRLLDIGCGPAATLRQIVAAYPPRFTLGVDSDRSLLARAAQVAPVLRCDARSLPLAAGSFDFVLLRFVLRHLPRPEEILREAARVTAPGGTVCVIDADDEAWMLHPEPKGWPELSSALHASARRRGGDPAIGRRLRQLLAEAGLSNLRASVGLITSEEVAARALVEIFLAPAARPVDAEFLAPELAAAAWAEVAAWAQRPEAFGWVVGVAASGKKS